MGDEEIARLSGGSAAEVAERRAQIVERLAAEVGAAPDEVRTALDHLAAGEGPAPTPARAEPVRQDPAPVASPVGLVVPDAATPDEPPAELVLPGGTAPSEDAHVILPDEPEETPPHAADELVLPPSVEPEAEAPAALELPGATAPGDPEALVLPPGAEPEPPASDAPDPKPAARPRRSRTTARRSPVPGVLGLAVGLAFVGLIVAGIASESGKRTAQPRPSATPSAAASPPAPPAATRPLDALPTAPSGVSGTVALQDSTLRLDVRGLEGSPGRYEVWLYDSLSEARSLGRLDQGPFALPPDAGDFSNVDVSLERDDNPNHSGRSVLRAELPR